LKLIQALHEVFDLRYANALWQFVQQTFSIATVPLSALDLNPKCSFSHPVMAESRITPKSFAVAMFYLFIYFSLRDIIISDGVIYVIKQSIRLIEH